VDAQVAQALQGIGQLPRGEGTAFIAVGNITVLAVDASEGAAGKEDRAGAAGTGDRRLLPKVRGSPGDEHLLPEAAETRTDGAVSAASART
jgi:hypothetical protein